ncbi:MAG: uroporphyrinogen decarboxylase family protein, partial [Clostridia bacterium]
MEKRSRRETFLMNARERFQKVMDYEPVDRIPVMALEPYEQTALERWRNEGYIPGFSPEDTLGMDRFTRVPVSFSPFPQYDHKVLFEDDETIIETERTYGSVVKRLKSAPSMYYGHLEHTVKTFEDWKRARERYDAGLATRFPVNMDCIAEQLNHSQNPVSLLVFPHFFRLGFYLMGMERFMLAFHDEPALIHDMFGFWNDFTLKLARPFLATAKIDCLILMEDLAYNNAPHVSPAVYKEFWLPYQDLLVKECKRHGVKTICLWTAG